MITEASPSPEPCRRRRPLLGLLLQLREGAESYRFCGQVNALGSLIHLISGNRALL